MPRLRTIAVAVMVLLLVVVASPVRAETVVRWATPEPAVTWDPHGADIRYTMNALGQVYDRLVQAGSDLRVQPGLAVSWDLLAPDRWRFELRPGVRFHDGTPLTAEDVVFSFERARAEGSDFRSALSSIVEMRANGPAAVEVRTHVPDLLLPVRIRTILIMSARWAREHGVAGPTSCYRDTGTYARDHAMGTGPFRLETVEANGAAVLVRNP